MPPFNDLVGALAGTLTRCRSHLEFLLLIENLDAVDRLALPSLDEELGPQTGLTRVIVTDGFDAENNLN